MPVGTHKIQFCPSPMGGSYLCEWHDNQPSSQSATPVTVAVGQITTVNARAMNHLLRTARPKGAPVILACDSFLKGDFIFQGRMKAHSLRGTPGAEVLEDLDQAPEDIFLPKRRFSAFFKTDLDMTLMLRGIDTVAVTGIATHFCVLTTALDALCHDFRAVLLEDCCAGPTPEIHHRTLDNYRRNPLYPLLRVLDSVSFLLQCLTSYNRTTRRRSCGPAGWPGSCS